MLEIVLLVHVIERFGGVAQVAHEIVAGDADHAGAWHSVKRSCSVRSAKFHDDDEFAVDHFDAIEGADERMADFLDAVAGL